MFLKPHSVGAAWSVRDGRKQVLRHDAAARSHLFRLPVLLSLVLDLELRAGGISLASARGEGCYRGIPARSIGS